ncbi:MAG: glycyl-tRNA synthetase beta chain [Gaiellaceae bacterium]|jgi:glycyl-tRNA synthetase beta chain|nr:glycyl-tRNA synthetase beta chain [Gaiellaceae bacterium]
MASLLLEIGCEELPASACREAAEQLPALAERELGSAPDRVFVGPRRLALQFDAIEEQTPHEWLKGPPVALREKAAAGFAKKHGVEAGDLVERDGFLGLERAGRPLREVVPERLDAIVRGLSFSKSMRWDDSGIRFARPVRWTLAKLDSETVAGETSFGHRFSQGPVEIPHAEEYAARLREAEVEPDADERHRQIVEGLDAIGNWSDPAGVLAEVVHLVESVQVLEGSFDERFLQLPERVVVTAMQSHQRYFPLGANRFAFVANGGDPELVRAGNEAVLEGRLGDASFTFDRDVRVGIDALAERLSAITYFKGAGSFADKSDRLHRLVGELGGGDATVEAARLAKADQASELVREFPDLEGYIGAEYARLAGYPEAVSAAIEEQYLPDSAGGPLPQTETGKVLAAADKLDALTTSFSLGHKPSGSRDPYGLRRAAIGLDRLAVEGGLAVSRSLLPDEVREFVEERLEGLLDVPVEFVRAARASAAADLGGVARLAEALYEQRDSPEFDGVYTAYERAHRLAGRTADGAAAEVDRALLKDDAERALADGLAQVEVDGDVREALASGATLAPLMERFFEDVHVMDEDEAVRANRLRLLLDVRDALGRLGDFSQIPR